MSRMEREAIDRALRNGAAILGGPQPPVKPPVAYQTEVDSDNWHPLSIVLRMGATSEGAEVFSLNQFGGASKRLELVRSMLGNILDRDQDEEEDTKMLVRAFTLADKVLAIEAAAVAGERKKAQEAAAKEKAA